MTNSMYHIPKIKFVLSWIHSLKSVFVRAGKHTTVHSVYRHNNCIQDTYGIRDIYQFQLLKLYYKFKKSLVPSYCTNFTIYNRNNVHTSRYSLRNMRVNIAIPQK